MLLTRSGSYLLHLHGVTAVQHSKLTIMISRRWIIAVPLLLSQGVAGFSRCAFRSRPSSNLLRWSLRMTESSDAIASPSDVKDNNILDGSAVDLSESQALQWARQQSNEQTQSASVVPPARKKYVVIGAGWAGWGAAKALCESGVDADITILDALPDPTGKTPYLSKSGKPVEAGTRGFWKDYPNINQLCAELGMAENDVFTEFTESSFYSPNGLEVSAPVFSNASLPDFGNIPFLSQFSKQKIPSTLPSPLGQVLATFPLFERLPLSDRASMAGLLVATVDCLAGDEATQAAYDRMTAHELFIRFNLSPRLIGDILGPTLLVGLFKPPEELSALVVMELLYYYALAHMDSFDVRWIKNGTVSDSLIAPLTKYLEENHKINILGGSRVTKIGLTDSNASGKQHVSTVEYKNSLGENKIMNDIDGVVLALSSKGMKSVVAGSPDLAQYNMFSQAASCKGIDVISVRLWLDKYISTRTPANVFARFEELRGAGGTFFMLDQFQSENLKELWGGEEPQGSVVACDFYNAGALLSVSEDEIIRTLIQDLLPSAVPEFGGARVLDSWVGKYEGAVSWFAPGTLKKRPPLDGIPQIPNLKCAGDWVRMGDREHGAKGLCQERAYVTGLGAANLLLQATASVSKAHPVLPVREDQGQFKAAVALNQQVMKVLPRFWVR